MALSEAETLGASRPAGNFVPRRFEFALPLEPHAYDPARARQLLAEAGYPNGFDAGEFYQLPPYFSLGEAIVGYLGAVGIRARMRPMERAAYFAAVQSKKLRGVCVCTSSLYGNAASRMSEVIPSEGAYAYGGYPVSTPSTSSRRARSTARSVKRCSTRSSASSTSEFASRRSTSTSGRAPIGPRVEEPALMRIDPYPWSAPLEDVRLKKMSR